MSNRFLTAFLNRSLKRLCQLSVRDLFWTSVFGPFCSVRQASAVRQLRLRQEARFRACGADYEQALLQVDRALEEKQDVPRLSTDIYCNLL